MSKPASATAASAKATKQHVYVLQELNEGRPENLKVFRTLEKANEARDKILTSQAANHWDWLREPNRCSETKVVMEIKDATPPTMARTMDWLVAQLGNEKVTLREGSSFSAHSREPMESSLQETAAKMKQNASAEFELILTLPHFLALVGWGEATAFTRLWVWRTGGGIGYNVSEAEQAQNAARVFQLARLQPNTTFDQLPTSDRSLVIKYTTHKHERDETTVTVERCLLRA